MSVISWRFPVHVLHFGLRVIGFTIHIQNVSDELHFSAFFFQVFYDWLKTLPRLINFLWKLSIHIMIYLSFFFAHEVIFVNELRHNWFSSFLISLTRSIDIYGFFVVYFQMLSYEITQDIFGIFFKLFVNTVEIKKIFHGSAF